PGLKRDRPGTTCYLVRPGPPDLTPAHTLMRVSAARPPAERFPPVAHGLGLRLGVRMAVAAADGPDRSQAVGVVDLPIHLAAARDATQAVEQALGLVRARPLGRFSAGGIARRRLAGPHGTSQAAVAVVAANGQHPGPPPVERVDGQPDGRFPLRAERLAG